MPMNTQALLNDFLQRHHDFAAFISSLDDDRFTWQPPGKWTAGQQLAHLVLCLEPISRALASKDFIREKFGTTGRAPASCAAIRQRYNEALANGGQAPDRFVPGAVALHERRPKLDQLETLLNDITAQMGNYTEEELDTLALPHPLLQLLSIREMICLMAGHATHHEDQARRNLQGYSIA